MTLPSPYALTIHGSLFLRTSSILNNEGTINAPTCETEEGHVVNGGDPCP
jgi:hypothetical protein